MAANDPSRESLPLNTKKWEILEYLCLCYTAGKERFLVSFSGLDHFAESLSKRGKQAKLVVEGYASPRRIAGKNVEGIPQRRLGKDRKVWVSLLYDD
ncbi:hypothetical protein A7K73_08330 [Candidatus Methylacidiphilum fumarolicum]|uniref:Uncharacterized protein n=2 Tax=Candidatus Methylacidiphilum fumarolicum TaxID=591154 RepID=I0JY11_METFB|nr:hypothetical protein A7K73_08330 [Candidatus Methylacidiphilum fumarolicum]TFE76286.1 hypothetical protein A7D33_10120 [Candidatus Methylacidiphilum fumarolicum]CAI9085506.1 conserved protein of unknown function [Candidatus Methylacidiphilum fumarolicum]CAI9085559.1 conserved protein of unknown function [Candidatus Methylacidiphilum fumarolicum]CCG92130.1 hypothetical protein MFUM_320001 [Methylacidiphilum fumariolicum SolV]